jgi:iron complex transport system permease protein
VVKSLEGSHETIELLGRKVDPRVRDAKYLQRYRRWRRISIALAALLSLAIILSLETGFAQISMSHIVEILVGEVPILSNLSQGSAFTESERIIVTQIRLPRTLAGVLVGASLSTSGAIFQGIFRNPMADPYILGVSSGAALGAAVAIVLRIGFSLFGIDTIPVMAFLGAAGATFAVHNIARVGPRSHVMSLLLSGIAVSIFLSSIVSVLQLVAGWELHKLVFWLMGGFSYTSWKDIWGVLPFVSTCIPLSYLFARDLNIIALGEEEAQHLGVDIERTRKILAVLSSFLAASAVSISGLIGFVGLIVPHITRILVGPDHRILLPFSLLTGALFLVSCDCLARIVFAPSELPVGVITGLSGGPFFIYLLCKKKGSYSL